MLPRRYGQMVKHNGAQKNTLYITYLYSYDKLIEHSWCKQNIALINLAMLNCYNKRK